MTEDEVVPVQNRNSSKPIIVLKALLKGHKVKIGGRDICMVEGINDSCIPVYAVPTSKGGTCIIGMDDYFTLSGFIKECEEISDDDIAIIAANMGLNK